MVWLQKSLQLQARARGFHLVTDEIVSQLPELSGLDCGLAHIFLRHTSASLSINENADPDVRLDMRSFVDRLVPEGAAWFRHVCEGPDDMPAHIKAMLLGNSLTIPVSSGRLALGLWQGIYLGEHRDQGGARSIIVTLSGHEG